MLLALLPALAAAGNQAPPTPELRARVRAALATASGFKDRFDAQVWLMDMSGRIGNQVPDPDLRVKILESVHRHARAQRLSPNLVLAVIDVESGFNQYALSWAGAQGLMQVMPFWREELGRRRLMDIDTNIEFGCSILRTYMDVEGNDLTRALARYNGSVGRTVYSQKVLNRLSGRWRAQ